MDARLLMDCGHHILRSGDVDIDPVRRIVYRGGRALNASPKACRLIFHLAVNHERAVSKEELAKVIWPGVTVAETSLRWLLKEVRRCLGDDGATQRHIETVRGYGLRWGPGISRVACDRAPMAIPSTALPSRGEEMPSYGM